MLGRGQRIGFGQQALVHGVGRKPRGDDVGPHQFGSTGSAMPSSAKRRAAFSVANSLRMRRAGLASAAVTVCQP